MIINSTIIGGGGGGSSSAVTYTGTGGNATDPSSTDIYNNHYIWVPNVTELPIYASFFMNYQTNTIFYGAGDTTKATYLRNSSMSFYPESSGTFEWDLTTVNDTPYLRIYVKGTTGNTARGNCSVTLWFK